MLGVGNHLQAADHLAIQPGVPSHVRLPSQLEVAIQRVVNCPASNQLQATDQLGAAIVNKVAAILHPSQSGAANQPQVTNWSLAAANPQLRAANQLVAAITDQQGAENQPVVVNQPANQPTGVANQLTVANQATVAN